MLKLALIEDQRMVRDMLTDWFESIGNIDVVGLFESAEQFLEWVPGQIEKDPACASLSLVTDLMMPSMSGSQLISCVRQQWPEMKIMALTGAREPLLFQSVTDKVDAIVSKNGDSRAEIVRALRAMGMNRRYVSPSIAEAIVDLIGEKGIPALEQLTEREIDIMRRIFAGIPRKAIAVELNTANQSISDARARVLRKLHPHTEFEIYTLFLAAGLMQAS